MAIFLQWSLKCDNTCDKDSNTEDTGNVDVYNDDFSEFIEFIDCWKCTQIYQYWKSSSVAAQIEFEFISQ